MVTRHRYVSRVIQQAALNFHVADAITLVQGILERAIPNAVLQQQIGTTYQHWLNRNEQLLPVAHLPAVWASSPKQLSVTVCWHLVQMAAKLLDDVEDGLTHKLQPAATTVNLATALLFVAQLALDEGGSSQATAGRLRRQLDWARLIACSGQHDDLLGQHNAQPLLPDKWLQLAEAKSGALFSWAAWAGAVASEADESACQACSVYGRHLGVLLQIADDFNDLWLSHHLEDFSLGSPNLAISYAWTILDAPKRTRFLHQLELIQHVGSTHQAELRHNLVAWGAQAYLLVVARIQQKAAQQALTVVPEPIRERLNQLLIATFPALAYVSA